VITRDGMRRMFLAKLWRLCIAHAATLAPN